MDIKYKNVKNPKYPGRPPSGCIWVKENSVIKTNDKGEVAYRKAKPSELKAKKTKAKSKTISKSTKKGKKTTTNIATSDVRSVFLSKRAYNELSFEELEKVVEIASSKIESSKAAERAKLEKQIEKLKGKLEEI